MESRRSKPAAQTTVDLRDAWTELLVASLRLRRGDTDLHLYQSHGRLHRVELGEADFGLLTTGGDGAIKDRASP